MTINKALRRTQRLVVIGTKEALSIGSQWVAEEILSFVSTDRQCVAILFPDSFELAVPRVTKMAAARKVIGDRDHLQIYETLTNLASGKPDRSTMIEKLVTTQRVMQRRTLRRTITSTTMAILALMTVASMWLAHTTDKALQAERVSNKNAIEQRKIAIGSIRTLVDKVQSLLADELGNWFLRKQLIEIALVELQKVEDSMAGAPDLTEEERQIAAARLVDLKLEFGGYLDAKEEAERIATLR